MAIHYKTQGIVIKKTERGESDRVFTVFTKDFGKLDVWAIGERKIVSKLRGGLELLYWSEFEFVQGKSKKTLTDALLLEQYETIRRDLRRLQVAFRMLETLEIFLKGQAQDLKIWALLKDSLAVLNMASLPRERCSLVYYYFFWNLVSCLGWRPEPERYDQKMSHILKTFLQGDINVLFGQASLPKKQLNEISRTYFIALQKELH